MTHFTVGLKRIQRVFKTGIPSNIFLLDSGIFFFYHAAPQCTCRCQHASSEPLGTEGPGQSGQRWHERAGRLAAVPVCCRSLEGLPWTQRKHSGGGASEELPVQPGPGRPPHRCGLPPARPPAAPGLLIVCVDPHSYSLNPTVTSSFNIRLLRGNFPLSLHPRLVHSICDYRCILVLVV